MRFLNWLTFFTIIITITAHKRADTPIISCAPPPFSYTLHGTIVSVQSGNWSDAATWGGRLPTPNDLPVIKQGHTVTADASATVAGLHIAGTLVFTPTRSVTLQTSHNLLVTGLLQINAPQPTIIHTIRFIKVNESGFVGGGMDPLDSDVGLWVMGAGKLDLQGYAKTSFTNTTGAITTGATSITVKDARGWQVNDEIMITPTQANTNTFDVTRIKAIKGNTIFLQAATTAHPVINNRWTAEVANLTRNVHIEGTQGGKSHVFIRSSVAQSIKNVGFRYLGPRYNQSGTPATELVQGRYGLHFHHCNDGSIGSMVDGCVMRNIDNHAYVPHVSNGITMMNNIAFDVTETPFWWDIPEPSHNIQWLHNLVALPKYIQGAISTDTKGAPTFGVNGFILGVGDDNVCNDNIVAGQTGLETTNAAYDWEEMPIESEWVFKNNTAHNCQSGLRSWQNNTRIHVIENSTLYNNGIAIFHGAYSNMYRYVGGTIYKSVIRIRAASDGGTRLRFENLHIDAAGIDNAVVMEEGPLNGASPILFSNCTITGARKAQVIDENPGPGVKSADFIDCHVSEPDFVVAAAALDAETLRVQPPSGSSFEITKKGKKNISLFAASTWGEGNGLNAAYYTGQFDSLLFQRIEPAIHLADFTAVRFHHKLTSNQYSIRYTGNLLPQTDADYTFYTEAGGGVRLWVNNELIIDQWREQYPGFITSKTIKLQKNKPYTLRLDYFNDDDRSGIKLYWSYGDMPRECVPPSQLFHDLNRPSPKAITQ